MIVQKDFLNKLKDFGLNSYEAKLWTALLSRGVATAGELSDIANVPRSRSYDVLESLEKKGFIIMKLGKPIKYIAVPPEEVLERVKKKVKEEADKQSVVIDNLKGSEVLQELRLLHTQGIELVEPTDLTGSFKGRNNLYNHLELMLKGAEKSVSIVTTSQGLVRKADTFKKVFEKLREKNIRVRIAAPLTKECIDAVKTLNKVAEIKHTNDLRARFLIVDGKEMTIMLLDDDEVHPTYDVGVWLNTQFFANAVEGMFDVMWKQLKPAKDVIKV